MPHIRELAAKGTGGMETLSVPDPISAGEIPHLLPGSSCWCLGQILDGTSRMLWSELFSSSSRPGRTDREGMLSERQLRLPPGCLELACSLQQL